ELVDRDCACPSAISDRREFAVPLLEWQPRLERDFRSARRPDDTGDTAEIRQPRDRPLRPRRRERSACDDNRHIDRDIRQTFLGKRLAAGRSAAHVSGGGRADDGHERNDRRAAKYESWHIS